MMNSYAQRKEIERMSDEDLDAAVLSAMRRAYPEWGPEDDAFAPTEYWSDCGPLIELFSIDVARHNGKWRAHCHLWADLYAIETTPRRAICAAVVLFVMA